MTESGKSSVKDQPNQFDINDNEAEFNSQQHTFSAALGDSLALYRKSTKQSDNDWKNGAEGSS